MISRKRVIWFLSAMLGGIVLSMVVGRVRTASSFHAEQDDACSQNENASCDDYASPRLTTVEAQKVGTIDFSDPQYSPGNLRLPFRKLFNVEPRDENWAPFVEKRLGPQLASDLAHLSEDLKNVRLECRSVLCRIRWDGNVQQQLVQGMVLQLYPHGVSQGFNNEMIISFVGSKLYGYDFRGKPDALVGFVANHRAKLTKRIREGTISPNLFIDVPRELWPTQ